MEYVVAPDLGDRRLRSQVDQARLGHTARTLPPLTAFNGPAMVMTLRCGRRGLSA